MTKKFQISNFLSVKRQALRVKNELITCKFFPLRFTLHALPSSEEGFTLIELLMYLAMFAALITILTSFFFSVIDASKNSEATSGVDQTATYLLARFTYDIQRAQSITTPAALGASSKSLQLQINASPYTYALDTNGNVQITDTQGANNLNAYDASISGLLFTEIGNTGGKPTIQLSFTVASRTLQRSGYEVKNYQTTIGIR